MDKIALIVDDDRTERRLITRILKGTADLHCMEAENGKDALRILKKETETDVAIIILDLEMPIMDGIETLEHLQRDYPHIPVIILTGSINANITTKALSMGAVDFLSKPVQGARLDISVKNTLKMAVMAQEISRLNRESTGAASFLDLIGHDAGLKTSITIGKKAAACDLPVLVTGETGTGKEIFSKAIHGESKRTGQPFIAVNCGAIPENLVESTLFGHEKGSFTGAIHKAAGKFQEANGGTIFLDEIGELPLEAQVKLLRVLQSQEVEPVGAPRAVPINVRIVSATNRDLSEEVKHGRFREDLYFRLNVLHIDLPPLRARRNDIADIAEHIISQFCISHDMPSKNISKEAMDKLCAYRWPGNVRELENTINRTLALSDNNTLQPQDFTFLDSAATAELSNPDGTVNPINPDGSFKSYKTLELEIMRLALAHHDNNMAKTARILGIAKSTLYAKMDKAKES